MNKTAQFDIETGPLPEAKVLKFRKPFPAFSEDAIKEEFKTARDPVKGPDFIAGKKADHEAKEKEDLKNFLEGATLKPETSRVLAIGWLDHRGFKLLEGEEAKILARFWRMADDARFEGLTLENWNGKGFDIPFLVRRSWACLVPVPGWVYERGKLSDSFRDLMQVYSCFAYGQFASLNTAALFLLGSGKPKEAEECDGANFWRFFTGTPEQKTKAIKYLFMDLVLTRGIGRRIGACTTRPGQRYPAPEPEPKAEEKAA